MRAGRLVQQGEPRTLYREPADLFAARFFCELNEVPATVRDGVAVTPRRPVPGAGSGGGQRRRGGDPAAGHFAASGRDRGRRDGSIPAAFSARSSSLPSRLTALEEPLDRAGARAGLPASAKVLSGSPSTRPKSLFLPRPEPRFAPENEGRATRRAGGLGSWVP